MITRDATPIRHQACAHATRVAPRQVAELFRPTLVGQPPQVSGHADRGRRLDRPVRKAEGTAAPSKRSSAAAVPSALRTG
eukprot:3056028-Pyramimonas_sp.AAC.1